MTQICLCVCVCHKHKSLLTLQIYGKSKSQIVMWFANDRYMYMYTHNNFPRESSSHYPNVVSKNMRVYGSSYMQIFSSFMGPWLPIIPSSGSPTPTPLPLAATPQPYVWCGGGGGYGCRLTGAWKTFQPQWRWTEMKPMNLKKNEINFKLHYFWPKIVSHAVSNHTD